jgi:polyhydroxyalkanoate synthesis regulator phasin
MKSEKTMKSDKSSKRAVALGLTAGLVGGGAAGFVLGVPGLSGAAGTDPAAIVVAQTDTDAPEQAPAEDVDRPEPGERVREVLQPLVDEGTITGEQADVVADHLAAHAAESRAERRSGEGQGRRGGPPGRFGRAGLGTAEALTDVLGIEVDALREALRGGSTIAEIAEANGVAVDDVVAALVAEATERIDVAVESGRLEADEAAERTEMVEERVTAHVNGEHPAFGRRPGMPPAEQSVDGET